MIMSFGGDRGLPRIDVGMDQAGQARGEVGQGVIADLQRQRRHEPAIPRQERHAAAKARGHAVVRNPAVELEKLEQPDVEVGARAIGSAATGDNRSR